MEWNFYCICLKTVPSVYKYCTPSSVVVVVVLCFIQEFASLEDSPRYIVDPTGSSFCERKKQFVYVKTMAAQPKSTEVYQHFCLDGNRQEFSFHAVVMSRKIDGHTWRLRVKAVGRSLPQIQQCDNNFSKLVRSCSCCICSSCWEEWNQFSSKTFGI